MTASFRLLIIASLLFTACYSFSQSIALDSSFGSRGSVVTFFAGYQTYSNAVAVQSDGKILIAGTAEAFAGPYEMGSYFMICRYDTNGVLDQTFGSNGMVISSVTTVDAASTITVQQDNKVIVGGSTASGAVLVRYENNGIVDSSFGNNGIFELALDFVNATIVQQDGKILAAGYIYVNYSLNTAFAMERCNSNGLPDSSFGTDGVLTEDFGGRITAIQSLLIQPDAKIVAAGSYSTVVKEFLITRYNEYGAIDSSFGTMGYVNVEVGIGGTARSVCLQSDGKIIAGGGSNSEYQLIRINADGSLDQSFGQSGEVRTGLYGTDNTSLGCNAVMVQPDGKILAIGTGMSDTNQVFQINRYNSNGSFNDMILTTYSGNAFANASVWSGGKILVTGDITSHGQDSTGSVVARYNLDVTTGISPLTNPNSILVFPNPTTGLIYFKRVEPGYALQVYNLLGQEVYSSTITQDNYSINLAGKAKGMYFYRVEDAGNLVQQGKIVLQ